MGRPGGTSGSTCQICIFASASQSTNAYASAPRSPMPYEPGSEVGCMMTPARRSTGGSGNIVV